MVACTLNRVQSHRARLWTARRCVLNVEWSGLMGWIQSVRVHEGRGGKTRSGCNEAKHLEKRQTNPALTCRAMEMSTWGAEACVVGPSMHALRCPSSRPHSRHAATVSSPTLWPL